ncbi:MAG TPA: hypothetical protein VJZ27_12685, partial [Aggregatilineales bacterium]|nr:hypothetical protein [Aggregatilineales bacterium]
PADARDRNLYLNDLNNGNIFNLTESTNGLVDYAVSPAGDAIAFTEYKDDGTSDIWLYHPASGSINQITDCVNASCGMPVWKPDGTQISYEREEYDPVFQQIGARRIWTVDLTSMQSTVLFEDTQITGHSATYSPSGNKIAMFATNPPGILIYDFVGQNQLFIDSMQGIVGEFSEDGTKIIYPILTRGAAGQQFYTQLEMVDFTKNQRVRVTASDQPIDDSTGVWRPGHVNQLAVSRRYLDTRYTDGYQVYLLDIDSGEATPLVVDGDYNQGALNWSPDGNLLVMQRFDRTEPGSRPQIWVYNMQTQELQLIAENAYLPGFLP